jgi:1,2-diacylglycerol 3-beta-glucosyltransferase
MVIVLSLAYTLFTFANSRRTRPPLVEPTGDLLFVYVVPCLDEAAVVRATLDRLLDAERPEVAVLIVDDGSTDGTAHIVRTEYAGRVWLLERRLPDARQGKGEALNAGYRYLLSGGLLEDRDPATVVLGVVDADGRVDPDALDAVAPYFASPDVGAVQIGVRMYNAGRNVLTRLQDMEFVVFTEVFQRGREWVGSVGLGGNGQFVRLSALQSLGEAPWTRCLTEDLDLGVRLLAKGWKNRFCPETFVAQEAVPGLRRLFRQRSRWFQGHVQSMRLIPLVMRSTAMSGKASFDVIYHLTSPLLVLTTSFVMVSFLASLVYVVAAQIQIRGTVLPSGVMVMVGYLLAFGMGPLFGYAYSRRERSYSLARAVALAHLYTAYGFLWFGAGWVGVWRIVGRRRGWNKTARYAIIPPSPQPSPIADGMPLADCHTAKVNHRVLAVEAERTGQVGALTVDEARQLGPVGPHGDPRTALDHADLVPSADSE